MRTTEERIINSPDCDAAALTHGLQLIPGGARKVISLAISRKKRVYLHQLSQGRCRTVTGPLPGLEEMWKSSPSFILDLDKSREAALDTFSKLAYKALEARPPREIGFSHDKGERLELIQEIILHFIDRKAAVLKSYKDEGRPFVCWFNHVAKMKAIELQRSRKPSFNETIEEESSLPDTGANPEQVLIDTEQREVLLRALAEMAIECQVLILAHFSGYTGKQIAVLHRLPPTAENAKKLDDRLLYCRRKLVDNANVLLDVSRRGRNADSNDRKDI